MVTAARITGICLETKNRAFASRSLQQCRFVSITPGCDPSKLKLSSR